MKYIHTLKYAATFILITGFLIACHSAENKETNPQTVQETKAGTAHEQEATAQLYLNNSAKWKADSSTNKNVSALHNVIEHAKPASLEDYHNTGKALQEGINKMIRVTTQFCPMGESITEGVKNALQHTFRDDSLEVDVTFDPPWSHERISEKGQLFFNK